MGKLTGSGDAIEFQGSPNKFRGVQKQLSLSIFCCILQPDRFESLISPQAGKGKPGFRKKFRVFSLLKRRANVPIYGHFNRKMRFSQPVLPMATRYSMHFLDLNHELSRIIQPQIMCLRNI